MQTLETFRTALVRLAVLLVGAVSFTIPASADRIALVIGNSDYQSTSPLANPVNDARLIAGVLAIAGFDVVELTDLDQRGMRRAVRDFTDKIADAGNDTVALLFYAGHGLQVDGTNYLVPVDADIERESDVAIEAVALPDVLSAMEFAGAAVNIVILDACRDNPLRRGFRSTARGLARVDAPTGSIVAYATAPGQTAADGDGENSPYSGALAAALTTPGLPIEQLFKQVRVQVKEATGDKQIPWESSSLTNDFAFIESEADTPPPPAASVARQPPAQASREQLAEADYLAAVATDSIDAYRTFLEKHPTGTRADRARAILAVKVETASWRRAERADTPSAYHQYLAAFPKGSHADAARDRIAALESPPRIAPPADAEMPETAVCGPPGAYRVVDIASSDTLSVRSGPDRNAQQIGSIPPNAIGVAVGDCVTVQGYRAPWCEVRYACLEGWAYARYLSDAPGVAAGGYAETYRVTGVETWDVLNMRSGPGTDYAVVAELPPDAGGVAVHACHWVRGFRHKWCEASWQGRSGWASACCLVGERTGVRPE